jgi:hypothetical protein
MAFLIQCKNFENIKMSSKDACDLFDGRLFYFCYQMSSSREDSFWQPFFHQPSFRSKVNCFLDILRSILLKRLSEKNSEFLLRINMGTSKASPEEIFSTFLSFNKSNSNKVTEIESLCFNGKQKLVPLQVNKSSHPLFKELLKRLECTYAESNHGSFSLKSDLEFFISNYKWVDTFNTRKFAVKNKMDLDEIEQNLIQVITDLNINSIRLSNRVVPVTESSRDTQHLSLLHLKQLFQKFKSSEKVDEELLVRLMVRVDFVWRMFVQKKYDSPELIRLVLSILDYFNLDDLSTQIKTYAKFDDKENYSKQNEKFYLSQSFIRFQMDTLGDHLVNERERCDDDKRSSIFTPDKWQVRFMDAIDKNESVIITAPTSSGKTYASFYAMEKVIKNWNSDSVLIYVSPTKALVNQTAYAIMDKFGHYQVHPNKSICGIFTRDFRDNLLNAKVLVTVPQCLKILIMNYAHDKWVKNIEYVVFDEIHTMGVIFF